jgi:hypothetical protein
MSSRQEIDFSEYFNLYSQTIVGVYSDNFIKRVTAYFNNISEPELKRLALDGKRDFGSLLQYLDNEYELFYKIISYNPLLIPRFFGGKPVSITIQRAILELPKAHQYIRYIQNQDTGLMTNYIKTYKKAVYCITDFSGIAGQHLYNVFTEVWPDYVSKVVKKIRRRVHLTNYMDKTFFMRLYRDSVRRNKTTYIEKSI